MEKKSTVLNGFFPYLAQMITSMRGCVAYNDLWPWPISSRSFGLGLENRVRSVASTVPDGVFPYLVQMITSMRRCVACDDLWPWPKSSRSLDLDLENRVRSVTSAVLDGFFLYLAQMITIIRQGSHACRDFGKKSGIVICDSRPGNGREFHLFCLEFGKMRASEFFLKLKFWVMYFWQSRDASLAYLQARM